MQQEQQRQQQLAKIEAMRQQQEQLKAKQEVEKAQRDAAMSQKRAEQASIMNIRRSVNKLRTATTANLEQIQTELNQTLATNLVNCGAQMAKIKEEAEVGLKAATERIELIRQKQKEQDEKKAEAARKKEEAKEQALALLQELEGMVENTEAIVQQAKEKLEPLQKDDIKMAPADKLVADIELITGQGKEIIAKVNEFVKNNNSKMKLPGQPETVEIAKKITAATNKNLNLNKELEKITRDSKAQKVKIQKRDDAKKKMNSATAKFIKYDKNKDGHFNKAEAKSYAAGEFKFKVGDEALNNIFSHWATDATKGINKESFQRLKVGIGMARELAKDAERKKARVENEARLEKLKEEAKARIEEATQGITETEAEVKKPENYAQPLLGKATKMEVEDILKEADEVEKQVTEAKNQIAIAKEAINGLLTDCDEDLKPWMVQEVKKLELRTKSWEARMAKATTIATKMRQMAKTKEEAALSALEAQAFTIIRYHRQQEKLDTDALFVAMDKDKDEKISQDEFVAFFGDCKRPPKAKKEGEEGGDETEPAPSEEELKKVFGFLDDTSAGFLSKPRFEVLVSQRMKVVINTPMTAELKGDSVAIRNMAKGEVVEVLEGPLEEPDKKIRRIKAKALKDGKEGYITVGGNGGTTFLRDWLRLFKAIKETLLTDDFDLDKIEENKSRKLKVGELVEVKENPIKDEKTGMLRMRCKAKTDGREGWATTQGNAGTTFFEPA
jgi:hypothetical protein